MKKIILKNVGGKENKSKGGGVFYTILFVAIVTVGTTAYIMRTRNDAIEKLETKPPQVTSAIPEQIPIHVASIPETVPETEVSIPTVEEAQWQSDDVIPVDETEEEVAVPVAAPITSLISPVGGDILKKHSDTELSYSKTMEDWRLHKGVDISAPIGSTVIASATGEVSECYTDTACGVTIVIEHGNGLSTKYSNLASTEMVSIGQTIESGDAIGVVGDTAEFEIADEAHLHFEVIKDGRSVNPEDYFN